MIWQQLTHRLVHLVTTGPGEAGGTDAAVVVDEVNAEAAIGAGHLPSLAVVHLDLAEGAFES